MTHNLKRDTVLVRPRVTEKAALQSNARGVYVFEVAGNATENSVKASIRDVFKVTPLRVRLLAIPTKKVFRRGKAGVKGGGKKAYIYLKKGDTIDVI
jgi:large subunit ribosomal protein L23